MVGVGVGAMSIAIDHEQPGGGGEIGERAIAIVVPELTDGAQMSNGHDVDVSVTIVISLGRAPAKVVFEDAGRFGDISEGGVILALSGVLAWTAAMGRWSNGADTDRGDQANGGHE